MNKSLSFSKEAYKELNLVKEHMSEELGVSFSLAKLIEHLAKEKVKGPIGVSQSKATPADDLILLESISEL